MSYLRCVSPALQPTYVERAAAMEDTLREFMFAIPKARAPPVEAWCCKPDGSTLRRAAVSAAVAQEEWFQRAGCLRTALVRRQCFFPDRRLLQYDCGKLVELDVLLRRLKTGGHRVLIFTQVCVAMGYRLSVKYHICCFLDWLVYQSVRWWIGSLVVWWVGWRQLVAWLVVSVKMTGVEGTHVADPHTWGLLVLHTQGPVWGLLR